MRKIIKDDELNPKRLKHFDFTVYETVERGEKELELEKVADVKYTPGEIAFHAGSFDKDVELHRAVVVQDRDVISETYVPESFDTEPKEMVKAAEPVPEPAAEPEVPAITEEELEKVRREAYQKGMSDGMSKGMTEGEQKAKKAYEAAKNDYLANLQGTYNKVVAELQAFKDAAVQLDDQLPDIISSMVTDIIGEERKINDKLVVSITKNSLQYLKDMEKIVFYVNPDDVESMTNVFPEYETLPDRNVIKGSLKVQTNIGELDFCIEKMLAEFVDRIHEEFRAPEKG